jgi:hypothetical protein
MDETTLLCESCGYGLAGLPETSACPECSRPIASSLPASRHGSPWQQSPGPFSWARSSWLAIRHPRRLFAQIRIEPSHAHRLLAINLLLASAAMVGPWTGTFIGDPARAARGVGGWREPVALIFTPLAEVVAVALILLILTWIEQRGIRFFAARRGWRLTKPAAQQICAHASIGWLLCGLLSLLFLATLFSLARLFGLSPGGVLDLRPYVDLSFHWGDLVPLLGLGGSYFLGMLAFELLVYAGVRECRYAARLPAPRATP